MDAEAQRVLTGLTDARFGLVWKGKALADFKRFVQEQGVPAGQFFVTLTIPFNDGTADLFGSIIK